MFDLSQTKTQKASQTLQSTAMNNQMQYNTYQSNGQPGMPQSLFTGKPGTTHFQTQDTTVVDMGVGTIEAMHCHIVFKI
tara:strand:+ start:814 stop:1050 length:237 start_codon:yes stop_codon:yes gene_type:complete